MGWGEYNEYIEFPGFDNNYLWAIIIFSLVASSCSEKSPVDLDVEEYEGDKGCDSEDDGEGQVHVELDVHRVIP